MKDELYAFYGMHTFPEMFLSHMCVCVCVCVRERERASERASTYIQAAQPNESCGSEPCSLDVLPHQTTCVL
jgi:hypothetical protein